jgi:CRISPR-associated protein Cas2
MRTTYLVCYDIADDKRLRKVFKTMRGYGDHLQFSVFECQLTAMDLVRLRSQLSLIIDHADDQVLIVNLGPAEGRGDRVISALGKPYTAVDSPCIVV